MGWVLNLPGLVSLFRLPGLNLFSYNRLTFAASFAILSLAVVGLEVLWQGPPAWRAWFWVSAAVLGFGLLWCLYRTVNLPEPLASQLRTRVQPIQLQQIQQSFKWMYLGYALLCGLGLTAWLLVRFGPGAWPELMPWFGPVLAGLLLMELLVFARDVNPQCDANLYYPPIPVLEKLAEAPPGRVLGVGCLPPQLSKMHQLRDIRGYDGVDPLLLVELLDTVRDTNFASPDYAATFSYVPQLDFSKEGIIKVPPVMSMLNLRYLIFRGRPKASIQDDVAGISITGSSRSNT